MTANLWKFLSILFDLTELPIRWSCHLMGSQKWAFSVLCLPFGTAIFQRFVKILHRLYLKGLEKHSCLPGLGLGMVVVVKISWGFLCWVEWWALPNVFSALFIVLYCFYCCKLPRVCTELCEFIILINRMINKEKCEEMPILVWILTFLISSFSEVIPFLSLVKASMQFWGLFSCASILKPVGLSIKLTS